MSTFADGFENKFSGKLKSMFSFSNLLKRDLTISDVAHARQIKNKLFLLSLNRNSAMETMNIVSIRKSIKILLQAHEKNF